MTLNRVLSNENVEANRNRISFEKGPVVYCFEGCDNKEGIFNLILPEDGDPVSGKVEADPQLQGAEAIVVDAVILSREKDGNLKKESVKARMIPYAVWNNRGDGTMQVWMPRNEKGVEIPPEWTPVSDAKVYFRSKPTRSVSRPPCVKGFQADFTNGTFCRKSVFVVVQILWTTLKNIIMKSLKYDVSQNL